MFKRLKRLLACTLVATFLFATAAYAAGAPRYIYIANDSGTMSRYDMSLMGNPDYYAMFLNAFMNAGGGAITPVTIQDAATGVVKSLKTGEWNDSVDYDDWLDNKATPTSPPASYNDIIIDPSGKPTAQPTGQPTPPTPVFVPVTGINGVPTSTTVDTPLTLTGVVEPSDATNKTIVWSVSDAGTTDAVVNGDVFSATSSGTATITATIENGYAEDTDYTKDFEIVVSQDAPEVISIEIISEPDKLTYLVGDTLDLTGLVVQLTMSGGDLKELTFGEDDFSSWGISTEPTINDPLTTDNNIVTVKHEDGSVDSFSITVDEIKYYTLGGNVEAKQADDGTSGPTPLPGATVTLQDADGNENSTVTNVTGDYSIELPAGTYSIVVNVDGYAEASISDINLTAANSGSNNVTLKSESTKLYSISQAVSAVDLENTEIGVAEGKKALDLKAVLHVQHGGKIKIFKPDDLNNDIQNFGIALADGDLVAVTAEDALTSSTYTIKMLSDDDLLNEAIKSVDFTTPNTANKVKLTNTTTGMSYEVTNVGTPATGLDAVVCGAGTTDIDALVGKQITIGETSEFPDGAVIKVLEVKHENIGPDIAPSATAGPSKGTDAYTAKLTFGADYSATMEYQIGTTVDHSGEWTPCPAAGSLSVDNIPASRGTKVFIRTKQTSEKPASAAKSEDLVFSAKALAATISKHPQGGSRVTATAATGNLLAYRIFNESQVEKMGKYGSEISINAENYAAYTSNAQISKTADARLDVSYLVIVEHDAAGKLVSWKEFLLTSENVNIPLNPIGVELALPAAAGTTTNAELAGYTKATYSGLNLIYFSNVKMTTPPSDIVIGSVFNQAGSGYTLRDVSGNHKFAEGAGTYFAVEVDINSAKVLGASLITVPAEKIAQIIKIENKNETAIQSYKVLDKDDVALTPDDITAGSQSIAKNGFLYVLIPSGAGAAKIDLRENATYATNDSGKIMKDLGTPTANVYSVQVKADDQWEFIFNPSGTYTIGNGAGTNFKWNTTYVTYNNKDYKIPENNSIASAIQNLKAETTADEFTLADDSLSAIELKSSAAPGKISIVDSDCADTLTITGSANTLALTSNDKAYNKKISIVKGKVDLTEVNIASSAATPNVTSPAGNSDISIKVFNDTAVKLEANSNAVEINGVKFQGGSGTGVVVPLSNGSTYELSGDAITISDGAIEGSAFGKTYTLKADNKAFTFGTGGTAFTTPASSTNNSVKWAATGKFEIGGTTQLTPTTLKTGDEYTLIGSALLKSETAVFKNTTQNGTANGTIQFTSNKNFTISKANMTVTTGSTIYTYTIDKAVQLTINDINVKNKNTGGTNNGTVSYAANTLKIGANAVAIDLGTVTGVTIDVDNVADVTIDAKDLTTGNTVVVKSTTGSATLNTTVITGITAEEAAKDEGNIPASGNAAAASTAITWTLVSSTTDANTNQYKTNNTSAAAGLKDIIITKLTAGVSVTITVAP